MPQLMETDMRKTVLLQQFAEFVVDKVRHVENGNGIPWILDKKYKKQTDTSWDRLLRKNIFGHADIMVQIR